MFAQVPEMSSCRFRKADVPGATVSCCRYYAFGPLFVVVFDRQLFASCLMMVLIP